MKRHNTEVSEQPAKKIKDKQISYNPVIRESINDNFLVAVLKKKNIQPEKDEFQEYLCDKGQSYELEVIKYIQNNIHPVVSVEGKINIESCEKTLDLINSKTPFIHSAKFCTDSRRGEIDLLVLSSHMHLLDSTIEIDRNYQPYYIVFEIKNFKLDKIKNTNWIRNSQNISAAKGQCYYYIKMLSSVLTNNHYKAYIIPGPNPEQGIKNIGEIDYEGIDYDYIRQVNLAEKAAKELNKGYESIDLDNIKDKPYLYPNMKCNSIGYNNIKEKIAIDLGEHTLISGVSQQAKRKAHNKGIYSFKDSKYTPEQIVISYGYEKSKCFNRIKNIISVNRNNPIELITWKNKEINCNPFQDYKNQDKIFLDFETLNDKIFLSGFYYKNSEAWEFYKYISEDINTSSETMLLEDFHKFYKKLGNPFILYWSADYQIYKRACKRNNIENVIDREKWIDMCNIFIKNDVAIKDCYDYKLKRISNAMTKHGLITCVNNCSCSSGTDAITHANYLYSTNITSEDKLTLQESIIEYNKLDCFMILEIFEYFM